MDRVMAVAIYIFIWWIVLFAVLPWGVRAQGEEGVPGTDPGAPLVPHLRAKLVWTTLVATAVFVICAYVYAYSLITLDDLARWLGMPQ
jgi:predicted secreted protein